MRRRRFLLASMATLAAPKISRAETARPLRFVPSGDVRILDPHWTPVYATRNHAYLVFDTLFGQDSAYRAAPQMVEGSLIEDDGRRWTLTLREGLKFHDGEPVRAQDCAASVVRWGKRDPFGQSLMAVTHEVSARDDRRLVFRMKRPFPLLPDALGKMASPMPAIMPERLAKTDAFTQVSEMIGSGPYRYVADERVPGARLVYQRFAGYRPRSQGASDGTAGPKIAHFERIEWTVIPEFATAVEALQQGEQDWLENVPVDLLPLLQGNDHVRTTPLDPGGFFSIFRPNHLNPPFNRRAIRQALLKAVDQKDFVMAIAGTDPGRWRTGVGFFAPHGPMASSAGLEALTSPRDLDAARREIAEAGYRDEPVVVLSASDSEIKQASDVGVDLMGKLGLKVDYQVTDMATMAQRRAKKAPISQGGWNCYFASVAAQDMLSPATNNLLRGDGSYLGWPNSPRNEELRGRWLEASDLAAQRKIAAETQRQAFVDVPYIPLGLYYRYTAYRTGLAGVLSGFPMFWNVRRTG